MAKFRREKPDLFIPDVMMPGMDGWEVYRRVMKIDKRQKVLFPTAVTVESDAGKTMNDLGVSDHLTKSFEPYELIEKVEAVLETS